MLFSDFGTRYFVYPGMVGFLTIPDAIYDQKAIDNCTRLGSANPDFSRGIWGALIGTAVACVLAFIFVQVIGFDDPPEIPEEDEDIQQQPALPRLKSPSWLTPLSTLP